MSTATVDSKLQNIIDNCLRMDNYYQHAVIGYSFKQEGSAFTIGGKIPKLVWFNTPEIPIGLIYVQEDYVNSLPTGELEFVVLHELSHIVNNDVIWNIGLFLVKEALLDWLQDILGTSKKNARDLIGLIKLIMGGKTIEEELTKQKELVADAYAVRLQRDKYNGTSFLQKASNGNVESPTHVTEDGVFFSTAITFKERIEAIQSFY